MEEKEEKLSKKLFEESKGDKKSSVKEKYIGWFSEIGSSDVNQVGGKAANLGEMTSIDLPVPPGFVIKAEGYKHFLESTKLDEKIYSELKNLDMEKTKHLEETAKKIREMIINSKMPSDLKEEIIDAYEILSSDGTGLNSASGNALNILKLSKNQAFVAVRSSATAEDSLEASFAGQQETFLNVKGTEELINYVKKCFASLFTSRSVYYRIKKGFEHEKVLNAVVVQKMVDSDKSGVIFSKNPMKNDDNVVIESVFGLGEGIVSGKIQPDYCLVSRDLEVLKEKIGDKKMAITRDSSGRNVEVKLTEARRKQKVLDGYEIKRLADFALKLEEHYEKPQDIEFAIEGKEIYITQTRPVTTKSKERGEEKEIEGEAVLEGQSASPGIGSGKVKIVEEMKDLDKIHKGNILVTKMTNPDMVVAMQKSSAIVTDEGGLTSHAAIVSREMGIPAVVGTDKATSTLEDGQFVTVDGYNGKIYSGEVEGLKEEKVEIHPVVETETKIKTMVDLPSSAERASHTKVKGVGLTRIEGIIAESEKHPFYFVENKEIEKYEDIIYKGLSKIAEYFDEMWVRTSDIRSDEYKNLEGAPQKEEGNPMLGMHGIRFGLKYPEILKAELKAISRIKEKQAKAGILLPQVISIEEVRKVKKIINELGIEVKLGVMVETSAAVEIIEDLCDEGIDFISFGTNDLTQYTLAIDRNNEDVQYLYKEEHPAVLSQIKRVIKKCKKECVETSICGQAGSDKKMVEFLVKQGIDSISVNADKAREISEFVKELEDKGLRGSELESVEVEDSEEEVTESTEESSEDSEESSEENDESGEEDSEESQDTEETNGEEYETVERDGKTMYKINCPRCNEEKEVPVNPAEEDRTIYCQDCYKEARKEESEEQSEDDKNEEQGGGQNEEQHSGDQEEQIEKVEDTESEDKEPEEESDEGQEKERPSEEEIKDMRESVEDESEEKEPEESQEEQPEENREEQTEQNEGINDDHKGVKTGKKDNFGRDIYEITCENCGEKSEVPFKPDPSREIFCKDCYKKNLNNKEESNEEKKENQEESEEDEETYQDNEHDTVSENKDDVDYSGEVNENSGEESKSYGSGLDIF